MISRKLILHITCFSVSCIASRFGLRGVIVAVTRSAGKTLQISRATRFLRAQKHKTPDPVHAIIGRLFRG